MKKSILLPVLALLGGAGGIALRQWQLNTAFEPDTHLPISGSVSTWVLLGFSLVLCLAFFLISFTKRSLPMTYESAFGAKSPIYLLSLFASGGLVAGAGILSLLSWLQTRGSALYLFFSLFALGAAICILLTGIHNFRHSWKGQGSVLLVIPGFFACVWLMVCYQSWARDPVVSDYVFALFAILATMLSYYYMAGYSFGLYRETLCCFTACVAIFCSMVALLDANNLVDRLLFASAILYLLPNLVVLCKNREASPAFSNPNARAEQTAADSDVSSKEEALHE